MWGVYKYNNTGNDIRECDMLPISFIDQKLKKEKDETIRSDRQLITLQTADDINIEPGYIA